jgi:hypothetical protein
MFSFFRRTPVYVKVYPNAIAITNLKTGETIRRQASESFSNPYLLVANFGIAEGLGREVVKELGLSGRSLKTIVQQMQVNAGVLAESEKRILRDLCEQLGSAIVLIITNDQELSNEEALQILNEN